MLKNMIEVVKALFKQLDALDIDEKVETINQIKLALKEHSPFKSEPVDCVVWVKNETVKANDYNPNSVAPPEMELLKTSILQDGYTQPIVTWVNNEEQTEVVDGFHRNRVGKEFEEVRERIHGYLPITIINDERTDKGDRMASTIRHNRARGAHKVESMSEIVLELKKRNWNDKKIAKQLGMDQDEVLRLSQITGLAEMFKDSDFSEAWEADVSEFEEEVEAEE
jgi:ParB-like chromosome segregation protein Spo0J